MCPPGHCLGWEGQAAQGHVGGGAGLELGQKEQSWTQGLEVPSARREGDSTSYHAWRPGRTLDNEWREEYLKRHLCIG